MNFCCLYELLTLEFAFVVDCCLPFNLNLGFVIGYYDYFVASTLMLLCLVAMYLLWITFLLFLIVFAVMRVCCAMFCLLLSGYSVLEVHFCLV